MPQKTLGRFKLCVGKSKKEHFVLRNTSLRFIFSERFVLRIILESPKRGKNRKEKS